MARRGSRGSGASKAAQIAAERAMVTEKHREVMRAAAAARGPVDDSWTHGLTMAQMYPVQLVCRRCGQHAGHVSQWSADADDLYLRRVRPELRLRTTRTVPWECENGHHGDVSSAQLRTLAARARSERVQLVLRVH